MQGGGGGGVMLYVDVSRWSTRLAVLQGSIACVYRPNNYAPLV